MLLRKVYLKLIGFLIIIPTYAQITDDVQQTPFGPAKATNVHFISKDHILKFDNGLIKVLNAKSGKIVSVYGSQKSILTSVGREEYKDGWNTYGVYGDHQIDKPLTYFSSKWTVPPPPKSSDQLLYLFIAQLGMDYLENGNHLDHIVQPVLQWGKSPAGGGNYWAFCNWYVNSNDFFYDSLIAVNPGTTLQGVVRRTSTENGRSGYNSYFIGYPPGMQIDNLPPLQLAYVALESYNADKSEEYPTTEKIKFFDIQAQTDSKNWELHWTAYNENIEELGQFTKVISLSSTNGQIEIYFRKPHCVDNYDDIHFYPNPFNEYLHIAPDRIKYRSSLPDMPITNCRIQIIDNKGYIVKNYYYPNMENEFDLDLSKLKSGMYVLNFTYNNNKHAFKIIKK